MDWKRDSRTVTARRRIGIGITHAADPGPRWTAVDAGVARGEIAKIQSTSRVGRRGGESDDGRVAKDGDRTVGTAAVG